MKKILLSNTKKKKRNRAIQTDQQSKSLTEDLNKANERQTTQRENRVGDRAHNPAWVPWESKLR